MIHSTSIQFAHPRPADFITFWRAEFDDHGLDISTPEPRTLAGETDGWRIVVKGADTTCSLEIITDDKASLPDFCGHIEEHLADFDPSLGPFQWSGLALQAEGQRPPGFTTAKVVNRASLGVSWWRVTLALPEPAIERFSHDNWHFRLLRPKVSGRPPVWPCLNRRGTVDWPKGNDSLLERHFTSSTVDRDLGQISFDVFRHECGPTSDWAASATAGETVGLMGPSAKGGARVQAGESLIGGGDETAVPAILRSLHGFGENVSGHVILLVGDPADRQASTTPGMKIRWLFRNDGATEADLVAALTSITPADPATTRFWFAGSQGAARRLRHHAREVMGLPRRHVVSTAYWS